MAMFRRKKKPKARVIGRPTNVSHDTHIGWDSKNGFDVRNIPPEWKMLFKSAGVKKSEVADPETRSFIMSQIRQSVAMNPDAMSALFGGDAGGGPPPSAPPPPPPPAPPAPPPPAPVAAKAAAPAVRGPPRLPARLVVGGECEAIYPADGNWYAAVVNEVRADGFVITYTEYGETATLTRDQVRALKSDEPPPAAPVRGGGGSSGGLLAGLSSVQLKKADDVPDVKRLSVADSTTLTSSLAMAMESRRKNMCVSVYHTGDTDSDDGWSDDDWDE
mmetsp:Transcript_3581/g.8632  ORF Transcript_3581/g.8632 Transcript_3581/m.8632 type:complete len:274 (-) Transcript_3581:291-1112(-)|eukprot:CAMPEP_0177686260 /NCGR_PEP_ID=MMETSP0447-20121125/33473_1 /TAXON_ID=0 /ORGANISM="Stygamoeba regulata, Strain BSH-02190019" /LENGTH=273 /DNA_ID=CAMNT_0019196369 /DNA_START=59 /DNA_END=880 /DNA_ORIENTATION=-